MSEEEYLQLYYKRYLREPIYRKACVICFDKNGQILTEAGIIIKATSGKGLCIQYERLNKTKITSIVYGERQYIEELYKITEIAYKEHPNLPIPFVKEDERPSLIREKVKDFVKREEGLLND